MEDDKKRIREAVEYVFRGFEKSKASKTGRRMVAKSYCKGINGVRDYGTNMPGLCDHPECVQCRNFDRIFKEEVARQIKELEDGKNVCEHDWQDSSHYVGEEEEYECPYSGEILTYEYGYTKYEDTCSKCGEVRKK